MEFLHACVIHGIEQLAETSHQRLKEDLGGFKDLLIQDSTIIRVHEKLAKQWPAVRSRKVAAGVKLSLLVSAVADSPKLVLITGERTSDIKTLRIDHGLKIKSCCSTRFSISMGCSPGSLNTVRFFITRVKTNADPVITQVYSTCRGRVMDLTGKSVSEILPKVKQQVVDAEVEVSFRRRTYNGKRKGDTNQFRLVMM